jgi:hypothetical protein
VARAPAERVRKAEQGRDGIGQGNGGRDKRALPDLCPGERPIKRGMRRQEQQMQVSPVLAAPRATHRPTMFSSTLVLPLDCEPMAQMDGRVTCQSPIALSTSCSLLITGINWSMALEGAAMLPARVAQSCYAVLTGRQMCVCVCWQRRLGKNGVRRVWRAPGDLPNGRQRHSAALSRSLSGGR